MKYRNGFVTNSNSSSYTCDYCGGVESGWDMSLSEAGMCECENNHTICQDHIKNFDDLQYNKDMIKTLLESEIKRFVYQIADMEKTPEKYTRSLEYQKQHLEYLKSIDLSDEMVTLDTIDEEWIYNIPESLCPICNFKSVTPQDMIFYLYKKYNETNKNLLDEIKTKFDSYKEFRSYIDGE